jgi:hypothetical protein
LVEAEASTSSTNPTETERIVPDFGFFTLIFLVPVGFYLRDERLFTLTFAADHYCEQFVRYIVDEILVAHSPIEATAAETYDGLVRFTFNPVREAFGFEFLLEFLIVDEFLIYLGFGSLSRSVSVVLGWQIWSPC